MVSTTYVTTYLDYLHMYYLTWTLIKAMSKQHVSYGLLLSKLNSKHVPNCLCSITSIQHSASECYTDINLLVKFGM